MSVDLKVPSVGESVTEIYIGKWYKSEGDTVKADEQLVELESEKATLDLRAPMSGVLSKIIKPTGQSAEVGEVIGRIDESGDGKPPEDEDAMRPAPPQEAKTAAAPPTHDGPKRLSAETVADPKRIGPEKKPAVQSPPLPLSSSPTLDRTDEQVAARQAEPDLHGKREERVPMSPVRRRIAQRLVEAQQHAALLTTFNEIDMTAVKELRTRHGESFERRHGARLGFMSFFVKAALEALRQTPGLNAIIDGGDVVYRRYYDIGVAISTEKGLVVPVLRNADQMTFGQIETTIVELAARARDGSLKVEKLQGGTFTITNGGVFGSLFSTPIVNPPQSGVLGMHAILDRPIAFNNQIVIRPMMYVALTYDHRIVDGREAVTFLRHVKEMIEDPARMLLEL